MSTLRKYEMTRSEFESRIEEFMARFRFERDDCNYECGDKPGSCKARELSCPLVQNFIWELIEEKEMRKIPNYTQEDFPKEIVVGGTIDKGKDETS